jgi:hypothetical protein
MKNVFITLVCACGALCSPYAQTPISVADLTLRIGTKSEEILHYAFAAGDRVLLSLEVDDGRKLKEVEVLEYPESVRFKDFEAAKLENKEILLSQKAVLSFRFTNTDGLKGRTCRVKIQRIPARAEAQPFNTAVRWVEVFDTTYVMVEKEIDHGASVRQVEKTRKVLVSVDTVVTQALNRTERVHSRTKLMAANTSEVCFELPKNVYEPNAADPYHTAEVVSWAYTITVGEAGKKWFQEANVKATAKTAASAAVKLGVISTGYGALAMLAIEGVSMFTTPPSGENINYETFTMIGEEKKILDAGNSVASSKRITDFKQGRFCILLRNDNIMDGINVDMTVLAVVVKKQYQDETYTVTETGPRKEKVTVKEPRVTVRRAPVVE